MGRSCSFNVCSANQAMWSIALQPPYLASPHLKDASLQVVLPDWQVPEMAIYALYPSRKHLSPAVRALFDFLVDRFATVPW